MRGLMIKGWLSALLFFLLIVASPGTSCLAADNDRANRYRILFSAKSADGLWQGRYVAANNEVIDRMARLLRHWPKGAGLRFVFVANRWPKCLSDAKCNPDYLLWKRQSAIVQKLKEQMAGNGTKLDFRLFGSSFINGKAKNSKLPSAPKKASVLYLNILVDRKRLSRSCHWQVLVDDPALPPAIATSLAPTLIPLSPNNTFPISGNATFRIGGNSGLMPFVVWENAAGEYLKTSQIGRAPHGAKKLHLIARNKPSAKIRRFLSSLSGRFSRPAGLPVFLESSDGSKGIGDHGEFFGSNDKLHSPQIQYCRFTFTPFEGSRATSSR